jgi:sugar lactone lactonase YvrE
MPRAWRSIPQATFSSPTPTIIASARSRPIGTIFTLAGDGFPGFRGDGGPASAARLNTPYGIAVNSAGTLYIADLGNNRVRQIAPDGTITTVNGTEKFLAPRNVAVDAAGNLYVSEFGGHRVRRIAVDGTITTIAGIGTAGFSGDGGSAKSAQLNYPAGLAFDSAGNLYIADSSNNRVREVLPSGMITTVLGTDAPGATLPNQLNVPTGLAIDSAGNLDVADNGNQRIQHSLPLAASKRCRARGAILRPMAKAICSSLPDHR